MTKDSEQTEVVFRKFRDGEIIALFPYEPERFGNCSSYMHIGQHGTAHLGLINDTKLAQPEEYMNLFAELQNVVGYELKVLKRVSMKKYNRIYQLKKSKYN